MTEARAGGFSMERVEAMLNELNDQSQLNAAMFAQVFSGEVVERGFFAAHVDKANFQRDDCDVPRGWAIRIEGDFHLVHANLSRPSCQNTQRRRK